MFILLDNASSIPLYQQIADELKARILSGELKPGAPLPSIRQLAADLVTSVITTKRAYQELESAGLIQTHQGRGTYVADLGGESAESLKLEEIRALLRDALLRSDRMGISRQLLRELFDTLMQTEERPHD